MIPSPVCLTSRPVCCSQGVSHDRVVLTEEAHRAVVTESFRHLRRSADVGEEHRPYRRFRVRVTDRVFGNRAEERAERARAQLR